jgi:multidrug efflux pump subunit AcrA (membrane-fusion protein)
VIESRASQTTTLSVVTKHGGNGLDGHSALLIISPVLQDEQVAGLIEIVQRPLDNADALRGNRRFLELVCQTAGDYLTRRELIQLRRLHSRQQERDAVVQKLHRRLDVTTVAYVLVNEGRRLAECDRLGVAMRQAGGFRLVAMSGVDTIDRRSNAVRRLEDLVMAVALTGEPFWYNGGVDEWPPQISEPLRLYLDESHVRCCGILPLRAPGPDGEENRGSVFAAIVSEHFSQPADGSHQAALERISADGKLALLNALRYEALPTLPFARHQDVLVRRPWLRSRAAWVVAAGTCLLIALWLVRVDFGVYAEGQLQPLNRQEVFAPMDGRVARLAVRHGEQVEAGSILLELISPQLDVEILRVQGEYETTRKRLSVVESSLLEAGTAKQRDSNRAADLAAEQEELNHLLESQRLQLELLAQEREKLVVRSPMHGSVLTWDVEQALKDRPVERGQSLVAIGDLKGRWVAELAVPDDRVGPLMTAQSTAGRPLAASFQLATDRRHEFQGAVRRVSDRTEMNKDQRPVVRTTVDFDESAMQELRPGATVFARIHCGKKPLGYVWFHKVIETIRGWVFYWLG